ncbi:MAG: hypothetical protein JXA24_03095 [Proteobacteria bacterium]|nr:hypothetical protein [Pseudomonadota bacterium]
MSQTTGTICMTGDYSYRVDLSGATAYDRTVEVNPFESAYQGSIGGQIRGLASLAVEMPGSDTSEVLFWGSGASIKYGTLEKTLGQVLLKKPGAVNDIAPILHAGKRMLVYGTERGLGIAGPDAAGTGYLDYSTQGAWRSVPDGVSSLDVSDDGAAIFFTSSEGFVQQIALAELIAGEECSGVIAAEVVGEDGSSGLLPARTQAGSGHIFVLSKPASSVASSAPTFEQAYYPIFSAMIGDGIYGRVRAYPVSGGSPVEMGFAARNSSFDGFDRFIPTDIAWDGQSLYVVGLAYDQQSVSDFLAQKCSTSANQSEQLKCMAQAAKDGTLATFDGGTGIFRFIGGFFVYRDMSDLSKADHFKQIQLTGLKHQEDAPPYLFAIAVQSERAFVRGPNFLASIARGEGDGGEGWKVEMDADKSEGLVAGVPNRMAPYLGGAAASFTAMKGADGSGASAVEVMTGAGSFSLLDTGAIYVRPDGAGQSTGLIAAIEMQSDRGGWLYLENAASRHAIDPGMSDSYVSGAAYDGATVAFAASQTGTATQPEYMRSWHIMVQSGSKASTRGSLPVARGGGSNGEFVGFPEVKTGEEKPSEKRGVAGIGIGSGAVAVLYRGYSGGKWYHQLFLYGLTKTGDVFNQPSYLASSALITTVASSSAHGGRVLRVAKSGSDFEVIFTTPKNIYKWVSSSGTPESLYSSDKLVDAALDAKDPARIAIVSGFNVHVKSLSAMAAQGASVQIQPKPGTTMTYPYGAKVALSGSALALTTPYGADATFSVFQAGSGSIAPLASTKLSRFLDVRIFGSFPNHLLASSQSSGIEIYGMSGN